MSANESLFISQPLNECISQLSVQVFTNNKCVSAKKLYKDCSHILNLTQMRDHFSDDLYASMPHNFILRQETFQQPNQQPCYETRRRILIVLVIPIR